MIGETILHYKILEKLGEGGMGEVFKAKDTKLDRFVALKFLPSNLTSTSKEKERFIQEAKAASAMNHPNICTIHDIQQHNEQLFIVMEYVDGKTLKDKKDSLSEKQILEIGIQVAEGLAAAHEKGIVHRDIKPENIMIRKDGIAQIMDFGLAKLYKGSNASSLTKVGTTVGTLGYMSPEQVQGLDVDHRTDIFSLGVVLYEMLTGESPFKGMHETAIMYEIVNIDAPPLSSIKEEIDPEIDKIILECLEKEKDERCQSSKELAKDLRKVKRSTGNRRSKVYNVSKQIKKIDSQLTSSDHLAKNIFSKVNILIGITLILLVTVIFLAVPYLTHAKKFNSPEVRSSILTPVGVKLTNTKVNNIAISPDGKYIAFVGSDSSGTDKLWIRPVNSLKAKYIAEADENAFPFWSPNSNTIAYFFHGKLKKVSIDGSEPTTICDASFGEGGTWNKNGTIIFSPTPSSGLYQVSSEGGKPELLIKPDSAKEWASLEWPYFLPDGKQFLYTAISYRSRKEYQKEYAIYAASLDNHKSKLILRAPSNAQYSNGYLFYVDQGILFAKPFDTEKDLLNDQWIPIANHIQYFGGGFCRGAFSVSKAGSVIYVKAKVKQNNLALIKKNGDIENFHLKKYPVSRAYFSPNEKFIAYYSFNSNAVNTDIWIYNKSKHIISRFTYSNSADIFPVWSPDGKKIAFSSNRSGNSFGLFEKKSDGAGTVKTLFTLKKFGDKFLYATDWSRDGNYIALYIPNSVNKKSRGDIWILPVSGNKKPIKFQANNFDEGGAKFSPDGKWIAYWSNESGSYQVYISPSNGKKKWQITNVKNLWCGPFWVKNGHDIYFGANDNKILEINVEKQGNKISFGNPKLVSDLKSINKNITIYDVNKNGDTFVAGISDKSGTPSSITMLTNWQSSITQNNK